ncbi:MAG: hypothetical protein Q7T82_00650 [Armatimonadota bacterium]|nr:hypothetical protein [Armatimonadota bacterium]
MPRDRLNDDSDRVVNLDDLIEAREERTSAFADDVDALEDIENVDVDVDDALTFPHPHVHRENETPETETLETPPEEDIEFDYQDSAAEMLPSDYAEPYSDALTTQLADDEDVVAGETLLRISEIPPDDLIYEGTIIDTPEEGGPPEIEEET